MGDAELLGRFLAARDEAAFEALVARHGPMVLSVCRNVLADRHDAEDAFQATFLVFSRRAATIKNPEAVGAWLHGVACRVASRARLDAARRRSHERKVAVMATSDSYDELAWQELRAALHEAVGGLPEKYRVPVVLCYLEGQSHEEAARHLKWPIGTVKGRLARARDLLQARLARRRLAIPATACLAALSRDVEAVPDDLVRTTVEVALRFAAGETGVIPESVAAWAEAISRGKQPGEVLAEVSRRVTCAVITGAGLLGRQSPGGNR